MSIGVETHSAECLVSESHASYDNILYSFPGSSAGKESTCIAGAQGSIPGLGRSPGEGKSCPLQYSDLENPMDCIVHGVTKSWTRLSDFHFYVYRAGLSAFNHHVIYLRVRRSDPTTGPRERYLQRDGFCDTTPVAISHLGRAGPARFVTAPKATSPRGGKSVCDTQMLVIPVSPPLPPADTCWMQTAWAGYFKREIIRLLLHLAALRNPSEL